MNGTLRNAIIALVAFLGLGVAGANTTGGLQIGLVIGALVAFVAFAFFGWRYLEKSNRA